MPIGPCLKLGFSWDVEMSRENPKQNQTRFGVKKTEQTNPAKHLPFYSYCGLTLANEAFSHRVLWPKDVPLDVADRIPNRQTWFKGRVGESNPFCQHVLRRDFFIDRLFFLGKKCRKEKTLQKTQRRQNFW